MIRLEHAETGETINVLSAAGYGSEWQVIGSGEAGEGDVSTLIFVDGAYCEDPALVEAQLIAAVKAEAERRKADAPAPGPEKAKEHAAKRAELIAWDALGEDPAAAFALLDPALRTMRFSFAIADAGAFGDTPADAIVRFRSGVTAAQSAAEIAAVEAAACAAIRAAGSVTDKRAAAAIEWDVPAA